MKIYGIDVSHHQGVIDWEKVRDWLREKNGGTSPGFAILRAGYSRREGKGGLVADGQILRNLDECSRLGIPVGVYVYCYDTSPEAAKVTMEQTLRLVAGYRLEYPVVYDMEYGTNAGYRYDLAENRESNTEMLRAAMETVEQAGYYGMVYCSRDFFARCTTMQELEAYDKWEAAYTSRDTVGVDNGIWQYSSTGRVDGICGNVDLDVAYRDYPGIIARAGLNGLRAARYILKVGPMDERNLAVCRAGMESFAAETGVKMTVEKEA